MIIMFRLWKGKRPAHKMRNKQQPRNQNLIIKWFACEWESEREKWKRAIIFMHFFGAGSEKYVCNFMHVKKCFMRLLINGLHSESTPSPNLNDRAVFFFLCRAASTRQSISSWFFFEFEFIAIKWNYTDDDAFIIALMKPRKKR